MPTSNSKLVFLSPQRAGYKVPERLTDPGKDSKAVRAKGHPIARSADNLGKFRSYGTIEPLTSFL